LCDLDEVHAVVTDSGIDSEWKGWLKTAGVQLVLASGAGSEFDSPTDPDPSIDHSHSPPHPEPSNP
jgi:hypothetical protein